MKWFENINYLLFIVEIYAILNYFNFNRRNSKERELMKSKNVGKQNENSTLSQSPHANRPASPRTAASHSSNYILSNEKGLNNLYSEDFNHQIYAQQSKISLNCCGSNNQNHFHNSTLRVETQSNDQAQSPSPSDVISPNSSSLCMSSPVSSVSSRSSLSPKSPRKSEQNFDSNQSDNNEHRLLNNGNEVPDNTSQFSDDESNYIEDSQDFNEEFNEESNIENEHSGSREGANSANSNASKNDSAKFDLEKNFNKIH